MSILLRSIVVVVFGVLFATAFAQDDLSDFFESDPNTTQPESLPLEIVESGDIESDVADAVVGGPASPDELPDASSDILQDLEEDLAADVDDVPATTDSVPATTDSVPATTDSEFVNDAGEPLGGAAKADASDTHSDFNSPQIDKDLDLGVDPRDPLDDAKGKPSDGFFGSSIRSRSVVLDAQNGFDGAIGTLIRGRSNLVPTSGLSIELFDSKSRRIREIATDVNGRFRVEGISSGVYQFVARGESGFLAFSLLVSDQPPQAEGDVGQNDRQELFLVQLPMGTRDTIEIVSAAVPPTFEEVNSIVKLHYGISMPMYMLRSSLPSEEDAPMAEDDVAAPLSPLDANSPMAKGALRSYEVALEKGNRLKGQLVKYDPETGTPIGASQVYVHIIRNDKAVGLPIRVNRRGEFEVELPDGPGAYSIVAAGEGGFGAAGFYAYSPDEVEASAPRRERMFLVSTELAAEEKEKQVDLEFHDPLIDDIDQRQRGGLPAQDLLPGLGGPARPDGNAGQGLLFSICSNDVIAPKQGGDGGGDGLAVGAGIGGGSGFAPPSPTSFSPPGFPAMPVSPYTAPTGGIAGGGGRRGLAPLLIGGGVAAAIAISVDDDDRRPVSPFSP